MIKNQDTIETSEDAMENAHLATLHEIHLSQAKGGKHADLPKALKEPVEKSSAQSAYERIIMYIKTFEETLDNDHEVGLGFAGGDAGVIKIEGLGYFDPDIVTYFGTNGAGAKTQLIQHVSQLNVMLTASQKHIDQAEPNRIGFQLAQELDRDEDATT